MLEPAAVALPVARVAVDVSLAHLDRPFDYAVTPAQDAEAQPGVRVRVRFAGTLRDGYVLERRADTEQDRLSALHKVISPEPVLTPEVARLIRRVADHYAGCFADVMRLAVPPRHAATEKAAPTMVPPQPPDDPADAGPWSAYPTGLGFLDALRAGHSPRAAWQVIPSATPAGDWAAGFAHAARACVASGRAAVLIAPDRHDLEQLAAACSAVLGPRGFATLSSEQGPAARYRSFLAGLRGQLPVIIGNRAAAFAPVPKLGLLAMFDDGDDLLAEPRAPYPHAREVLALRAADARAGIVVAGYGRTAEVQRLVESGWLRDLAADRATVRQLAPRMKVAADTPYAQARDPAARTARLPHEVFETIRGALPQGPVLVQVPRAGYRLSLVCADCREPARCSACSGPLQSGAPTDLDPVPPAAIEQGASRASPTSFAGPTTETVCTWCGHRQEAWECPICEGRRLRAPVVGAARTAEELGLAFPHTTVRRSAAGHLLDRVDDSPALVVATPGAEPPANGGYAAAVLLDTVLLMYRPDLRAGEEALRRWLNATALVRSGADGGSVIAVGESASRPLQALVRVDPVRHALREWEERAAAGFPPAVRMVMVEGSAAALTEFRELARLPASAEVLGHVPIAPPPGSDSPLERLTVRSSLVDGAALVGAVRAVAAIRTARKSEGALRIRVDPAQVG